MGARSEAKARAAITKLQKLVPNASVEILLIDHMNLASVRAAAEEYKRRESQLHGLINNAGIMAVPFEKSATDGYESQWQTNYVAHWLLTYHLLPTLLATAKTNSTPGSVRVVNVTSTGHKSFTVKGGIDFADINQEKGGVWSRYGQSKLANVLHTKMLNALYGPKGTKKSEGEIWSGAVHPGVVQTDLAKNAQYGSSFTWLLKAFGVFIPADQGAYNTVFVAASQDFTAEMSGQYFVPNAKLAKPHKNAENPELAKTLWDWTEREMREKGLL